MPVNISPSSGFRLSHLFLFRHFVADAWLVLVITRTNARSVDAIYLHSHLALGLRARWSKWLSTKFFNQFVSVDVLRVDP